MAKQEKTQAQDTDPNKELSSRSQQENGAKQQAEQGTGERTHDRPLFVPPVDIYETEKGLVVEAGLPGAKPDGVPVTLETTLLSSYDRVAEEGEPGYRLAIREYEIGNFERQFTLSADFDLNGIEADYNDGMLRLIIPSTPEPEANRIQVRT